MFSSHCSVCCNSSPLACWHHVAGHSVTYSLCVTDCVVLMCKAQLCVCVASWLVYGEAYFMWWQNNLHIVHRANAANTSRCPFTKSMPFGGMKQHGNG